jgi:hypothetical protein
LLNGTGYDEIVDCRKSRGDFLTAGIEIAGHRENGLTKDDPVREPHALALGAGTKNRKNYWNFAAIQKRACYNRPSVGTDAVPA